MDNPPTYRRISSYEDMDEHLRTIADDILKANRMATYVNNPERGDPTRPEFQNLLDKDRIEYWTKLFERWDTDLPLPILMLRDPPTHCQLRVGFGWLVQDAQLSRNARRRPKKDPNRRRVAQYRRQGKHIYVEPRIDPSDPLQKKIQWFWADAMGKGIDHRITSLYSLEGVTPEEREEALLTALVYRDSNERIHTQTNNMLQTLHWMRCRLMRVLHERYPDLPAGQRAPNPTTADFDQKLHRPRRLAPPLSQDELVELFDRRQQHYPPRWQIGSEDYDRFMASIGEENGTYE